MTPEITSDANGRHAKWPLIAVYQRHDGLRWQPVRINQYGYSEPFEFSYPMLDALTEAIDVARRWNKDVGEIVSESTSEG